MSKFKVGDRVAVYNSDLDMPMRIITTLIILDQETGRFQIQYNKNYYWVHPNQCRRLKKKERRRIWIYPTIVDEILSDHPKESGYRTMVFNAPREDVGLIEFIEVRKKK